MSAPKSVIKVKKNNVEYTSNVDFAKYTILELTKAALRDIAKLLRKRCKAMCPIETGTLRKNIATRVVRKGNSAFLELGIYNYQKAKKRGINPAPHAHLVLFGYKHTNGKNVSGRNFLSDPTLNNVSEIRKIESQYLQHISTDDYEQFFVDDDEEDDNS